MSQPYIVVCRSVVASVLFMLPVGAWSQADSGSRANAQAKEADLAAQRRSESQQRIDPALLARAKTGDAEAQYETGRVLAHGVPGIEKDLATAFYWYQKSADQGNPKGENAIGVLYEYGNGVAKDYGQALLWLRKAAAHGNPKAEDNLGDAYYNGWGLTTDMPTAIAWYHKAAAQGNADAEFTLGWMYAHSQGVELDFKQATFWYRKAASHNNADAQNELGNFYLTGIEVDRNFGIARLLYQKAANNGSSLAVGSLRSFGAVVSAMVVAPPQIESDPSICNHGCQMEMDDKNDAERRRVDGQRGGLAKLLDDSHEREKANVDNVENRQLANRVYEAAFRGIDHVMKSQGHQMAMKLVQSPQNNAALVASMRGLHDSQYLIALVVIREALLNADFYIDTYGSGGIPFIDNSTWSGLISEAQAYQGIKDVSISHHSFLEKEQNNSTLFDIGAQAAIRLILQSGIRPQAIPGH